MNNNSNNKYFVSFVLSAKKSVNSVNNNKYCFCFEISF